WLLPAMLLIAAGMGFGLVGLQYIAVSGTTDEDAGIASGVQRAADQLGGASGVAVYVGLGFAPDLHAGDPFVIAAVLAVAGLVIGALVISRSPANTAVQPQAEYQERDRLYAAAEIAAAESCTYLFPRGHFGIPRLFHISTRLVIQRTEANSP